LLEMAAVDAASVGAVGGLMVGLRVGLAYILKIGMVIVMIIDRLTIPILGVEFGKGSAEPHARGKDRCA
jgi:hypothetical protein